MAAKNPNSLGMLIQAAKTDAVRDGDSESKRQLEMKISNLTYELENQEKEFEKKLRTMRQEQERIKARYESVQGQSAEAKQAKLLEEELQKTKAYYTKRIREIEDKHKYGKAPAAPKSNRSQASNAGAVTNDQLNELRDQNDRLLKERNILAQKVVTLESQNN
jgi:chromosome segregation ATPase